VSSRPDHQRRDPPGHRITDAALIAKALTRLEQVLNSGSRRNCAAKASRPSKASGRSRPDGRKAVIPGRRGSDEPQMRNCASGNLEIPGSMLRIAPE
jgi:hypothetical protein